MGNFSFRPAVRENVPLLVGLVSGTGGGKTFSALRLATGIAGDKPFCLLDTEAGRSKHYADIFRFDHGDLTPPFAPNRYMEAIEAADKAGYPVIVVDSMSHVWAGDGGCLDTHEEELNRMAGTDWKKREACKMAAWVRPKGEHKRMVAKMLQIRAHLILCFRAEEKVEMIRDEQSGKMKIVPKASLSGHDGWIPVCEKTLPFELTVSFMLLASQPGIPHPIKLQEQHKPIFPVGKLLDEEAGRRVAAWSGGAKKIDPAWTAREEARQIAFTSRTRDEASALEAFEDAKAKALAELENTPQAVNLREVQARTRAEFDKAERKASAQYEVASNEAWKKSSKPADPPKAPPPAPKPVEAPKAPPAAPDTAAKPTVAFFLARMGAAVDEKALKGIGAEVKTLAPKYLPGELASIRKAYDAALTRVRKAEEPVFDDLPGDPPAAAPHPADSGDPADKLLNADGSIPQSQNGPTVTPEGVISLDQEIELKDLMEAGGLEKAALNDWLDEEFGVAGLGYVKAEHFGEVKSKIGRMVAKKGKR